MKATLMALTMAENGSLSNDALPRAPVYHTATLSSSITQLSTEANTCAYADRRIKYAPARSLFDFFMMIDSITDIGRFSLEFR